MHNTHKTTTKVAALTIAATFLQGGQLAHAKYSEPSSYTNPRTTVSLADSRYDTSGVNDSRAFQRAIDDVAAAGGGRIFVPRGTYRIRAVRMKSNVHFEFQGGTNLYQDAGGRYGQMFTRDADVTENISFRGVGGRFNVRFSDEDNHAQPAFFHPINTINMLWSSCNVRISPKYQNIMIFSHRVGRPVNRHIQVRSITASRVHFGFGLVQTGAVHDSDFRNLRATGGSTVLLESDNIRPADDGIEAMDLVSAWNIVSTEGQAAVKVNPRQNRNGSLRMGGITSVSSQFSVLTETGQTELGASIDRVELFRVHGVYGSSTPVVWSKSGSYPAWVFPNRFFRSRAGRGAYYAPSVSVIGNYSETIKNMIIRRNNVTSEGRYFLPDITDRSHLIWAQRGFNFNSRPLVRRSLDVGWYF